MHPTQPVVYTCQFSDIIQLPNMELSDKSSLQQVQHITELNKSRHCYAECGSSSQQVDKWGHLFSPPFRELLRQILAGWFFITLDRPHCLPFTLVSCRCPVIYRRATARKHPVSCMAQCREYQSQHSSLF